MTDAGTTPVAEEARVGHCKRDSTDVYIGRGRDGRSFGQVQIGDRGWLGNPFPLADGISREQSIEMFRMEFEDALEDVDELREAVAKLHGKTLGCWCRSVNEDEPACHGDVIAEHADRLAGEYRIGEDEDGSN